MRVLFDWRGGLFWTEGEIGVLFVSSLFLTRVGVYLGAGVCIRTHTQTQCTYGVLGCETSGPDETPGGPEESRWTKSRHTRIRICVTHVYVYPKRWDEILDNVLFFLNIFFLSTKNSRRCESNPPIISNLKNKI